jgi:integrase
MAHHPFPFFRAPRSTWFVEVNKKQIPLGKHPKHVPPPEKDGDGKWVPPPEIMKAYHRTMADADDEPVAPAAGPAGRLVVEVLEEFMDKYASEKAARTYEWYQRCLKSFRLSLPPGLTVADLAPGHVTAWVKAHAGWSPTTKHGAIHAVKKAVLWGCKEWKLGSSPLADVSAPTPTRREVVITPEQWPQLLSACTDGEFRDLLTFLWETGARTQEARQLEARHFDAGHKRVVFPASESKGKRFPRVIYLTPQALAIVRRLALSYPEGKLFRDSRGRPWTRNALRCRFRRQRIHRRVKLKIPGICCTAIRHSYATNALRAGVDPVTLSVLMGHADASMVAEVYQHLAKDPEYLRQAATKAVGGRLVD